MTTIAICLPFARRSISSNTQGLVTVLVLSQRKKVGLVEGYSVTMRFPFRPCEQGAVSLFQNRRSYIVCFFSSWFLDSKQLCYQDPARTIGIERLSRDSRRLALHTPLSNTGTSVTYKSCYWLLLFCRSLGLGLGALSYQALSRIICIQTLYRRLSLHTSIIIRTRHISHVTNIIIDWFFSFFESGSCSQSTQLPSSVSYHRNSYAIQKIIAAHLYYHTHISQIQILLLTASFESDFCSQSAQSPSSVSYHRNSYTIQTESRCIPPLSNVHQSRLNLIIDCFFSSVESLGLLLEHSVT